MGHEHSSVVIVGFTMDQDDFLMPFKTTTAEKFHMEERFDQKTGKKAKPVKVVDEEPKEGYVVEGEFFEYPSEAVDAVAVIVGCDASTHGNMCTGEYFMVGIEPNGIPGELKLTDVAKFLPECERIKAAFAEKFGLDLGDPVITTLDSYG